MRRFGQILMGLGAMVGGVVAIAILGHFGLAGFPWLVNVALAKLGIVGSLGLMAGGAATIRLAGRRKRTRTLPRAH